MSRPLSTALARFGAGIGRSLAIITPGSHKDPAGDTMPLAIYFEMSSPQQCSPWPGQRKDTAKRVAASQCACLCCKLLVQCLKRRRCTGMTCQTACGCAVSSSCTR